MSDSKSLDGVVVAFVESASLAFLNLSADGGLSAEITDNVIRHELLVD